MSDIFSNYGEPTQAHVTVNMALKQVAAIATALWVSDQATLEDAGVAPSAALQVGPIFDQFDAFLVENIGVNWLTLVLTSEAAIEYGLGETPPTPAMGCRGSL